MFKVNVIYTVSQKNCASVFCE